MVCVAIIVADLSPLKLCTSCDWRPPDSRKPAGESGRCGLSCAGRLALAHGRAPAERACQGALDVVYRFPTFPSEDCGGLLG